MISRFTFAGHLIAWTVRAAEAVLLLFSLIIACRINAQRVNANAPLKLVFLLGRPAPQLVASTLDGKVVALGDYRGRPVIVNFWATWCGNCKLEMPWLAQLREKYASQGLEVLGIVTDNPGAEKVKSLARKYGVKYPILVCNHATARAYGGVPDLPESIFIDRRGKVVAVMNGADSEREIEANIRKALSAPPR